MQYDKQSILQLIAQAPDAQAYPDADALILREQIHYTIDSAGVVTQNVLLVQKYLTVHSYNFWGDPRCSYHHGYQEATLHLARTYCPDGRSYDAPAPAQNHVMPRAIGCANRFDDYRDLVVTLSALDLNHVSVLHYEIRDTVPWRPWFWQEEFFMTDRPCLEKQVVVRVPQGQTLHHAVIHGEQQPEITCHDGYDQYTWQWQQARQAVVEGNYARQREWVPYLTLSTCPCWEELQTWLCTKVQQAANRTPEIVSKVREIAEKHPAKADLLLHLHRFVHESIRLIKWDPRRTAYQIAPAGSIYKYSNGNWLDKGVLFLAMLQAAGFQTTPLLVADQAAVFPRNVPSPCPFNQMVVKTTWEHGSLTLDPTKAAGSQQSLSGRMQLSLREPRCTLQETPLEKPDGHQEHISMQIKVDDQEQLSGSCRLNLTGSLNPYLKWYHSQEGAQQELANYIKSWLPGITISKTLWQRYDHQVCTATVEFKIERWRAESDQPLQVNFAESVTSNDDLQLYRQQRRTTLRLNSPLERQHRLELTIPQNLKIIYQGTSTKIDNSAGCLQITVKFDEHENRLTVTRYLRINPTWVLPDVYPDWRHLWLLWSNEVYRTVLLATRD